MLASDGDSSLIMIKCELPEQNKVYKTDPQTAILKGLMSLNIIVLLRLQTVINSA
jgi:hypothetical protein